MFGDFGGQGRMMKVFINGVSAYLPGAPDWSTVKKLMLGATADAVADALLRVTYKPSLLPANERRRASESVKLAFAVCEPIFLAHEDRLKAAPSVFASSGGDYIIFDKVCRALCTQERHVSPTLFHNSVHNAPAGYWSIASESMALSTSIAAGTYTAAAGVLEAAAIACEQSSPVLLACYDICPVSPIADVRNIDFPFGFGLLLDTQPSEHSLASLQVGLGATRQSEPPLPASLSAIAEGNPVASVLPLLHHLACLQSGTVALALSSSQSLILDVDVIQR